VTLFLVSLFLVSFLPFLMVTPFLTLTPFLTVEGIKALTPELLSETLGRIRDVMNGTNCECVLK
jgi:hypothetical protein